ncbi:MAG: 50S ribosomal protein L24 [Sedimentisphaerales bacterium]|nr:50S ribosomal protein L24 [Sedimentisphaerales bacterium]
MAAKVKAGDMVEIIAGDDRGTQAKVLTVDPVKGKVVVEGVNLVYKHVRPSRRNPQGGRLHVERPIDISNVLPVSPKSNKGRRVHFEVDAQGKKSRVAADGGVIERN